MISEETDLVNCIGGGGYKQGTREWMIEEKVISSCSNSNQ